MKRETERVAVESWEAPWERFDYEKMEREARRECETIKRCLGRLERETPADAEGELLRRREVRLLTDMYYEQCANARLFQARARRRI